MKDVERHQARADGLVKFGPRGPCSHGHVAERYTINNACVVCVYERSAKSDKTRIRDPEERCRANKRYYAKPGSMGKQVVRSRKWKKNNPERTKIIDRVNRHKRRARLGASTENFTSDQIVELGKRQKWRCANLACHISIRKDFRVDHILALARGGSNGIRNIQLLCHPCNSRKHAKHPIEWARENGFLL